VLVLHEVTELRRLETLRRDFVANVSHELKTPLTAIRGLVETLEDDDAMPAELRRRFLGKIRVQGEHLAAQVADLLTLSRLESLERPLEMERMDLRDLARQALALHQGGAEERGLVLAAEIPDGPLVVKGERAALVQALGNLLDNALKYTPAGGTVTLRLRADGSRTLFEVEDTGIGIEPRDRERIFERFYRVDRARSRALGGTGLGLAIVKHVAQRHGGRVAVASVPGQGSVFTLSLPPAENGVHQLEV
jgi:two-component system phosphate regulon sensor histidine kinase PhoR